VGSSSSYIPVGQYTFNYYEILGLATTATFSAPSGTLTTGNQLLISIVDDGTAQNITFPWTGGTGPYVGGTNLPLPTSTYGNGTPMILKFIYMNYFSTSAWYLIAQDPGGLGI
jgi:hypothetical protein